MRTSEFGAKMGTMSQPEAFDIDRIITETFVREVRYFDTIRSTNDVALESCGDQELATPWLVVAAEQTAGRGRGSNRWWSARGSLTFSVVIAPAALGLHERDWPTMSLTTGLAVCLAIGRLATDQQTALKWPNDVYLQNKKVSGVLLEVGPRTAGRLVLGVGINVNNSFDGAPEELSAATSLIDVTGVEIQLTRVLIDVLCELEDQLTRLARHDPELAVDWQNACMLRGRSIEVEAGSTRESGRCQGIDKDGALLLSTDRGIRRLFSGTVRVV
jgi:BirA family biotin operon repressor/biotin-[acetyl-CoA-carboxylase] ligase